MSNLYQLSNEVESLYNQLINGVDEDTGEVLLNNEIAELLKAKEQEFDNKAVAVATVSRRFKARAEEIDEEIKRLKAMKDYAEKTEERLKNALKTACEITGKTKIDGLSARISFTTRDKVEILDDSKIPDEFMQVYITKKPKLTEIKEAIKNGKTVDGAELIKNTTIQIK